ncbi:MULTISPECIES: hypothetical protein [unclassified Cryobacterium]|uniref:hypothetical protein n=1 Tax=unclassified Cryobacterium TaxID=2649013 RepID=UPI00144574FC|nr:MULTISPECIES: hypothetical protein [unclassified Cryobacterium]
MTTVGLGALLVLGAAVPASAADGDGAVLFNPDGTPIGSEYTPTADPLYVYTSVTGDDDYWGLDSAGNPANIDGDFGVMSSGIPLGFVVNVAGVNYDEVFVGSNGSLCLYSSTDATVGAWCDDYDVMPILFTDPDWVGTGTSYAAFAVLNNDQDPRDSDEPIDTDADSINDACEFGAFYFADQGGEYCSSISWGHTTYDGRAAFAATWYHNPTYSWDDDTEFNTYQIILVDDGAGNVTVVYNYDAVTSDGFTLDWWIGYANACEDAYAAGDTAEYLGIGMGGINGTDGSTTMFDPFGAECMGGDDSTPRDNLVDGGAQSLITNSLNSTVPGRYIFRVLDGLATTTMPAATPPTAPAAPQLAATGTSPLPLVVLGALALGLGLAATRRRGSVPA